MSLKEVSSLKVSLKLQDVCLCECMCSTELPRELHCNKIVQDICTHNKLEAREVALPPSMKFLIVFHSSDKRESTDFCLQRATVGCHQRPSGEL